MQNIIEINQVTKQYGEIIAVDNATLSIREGEVFSLIGHNGAGKSTLFKMMLGLLQPGDGEIKIRNQIVAGTEFRKVRRCIGYLPENVVFYDHLSGLETLRFLGALKGADPRNCMPLLEKMGLGNNAHRPVRGYSKGMRQRLGFAQALLGKPEILFLDEPTTGLDPGGIRDFYQFLHELKEQGVTIILSSHNLAQIQDRVDHIALMRLGKILTTGTVQALREQLDLPLNFHVLLHSDTKSRLCQALEKFPTCETSFDGDTASINCGREQKMSLLSVLSTMDVIKDIRIQEPSLEDLFLGYVDESSSGQNPSV